MSIVLEYQRKAKAAMRFSHSLCGTDILLGPSSQALLRKSEAEGPKNLSRKRASRLPEQVADLRRWYWYRPSPRFCIELGRCERSAAAGVGKDPIRSLDSRFHGIGFMVGLGVGRSPNGTAKA